MKPVMEGLLPSPLYRGGNEVPEDPAAQGHTEKLSMLPGFRPELLTLQHFLPLGLTGPPVVQTVGREGNSCVVISIHSRAPTTSQLLLHKLVIYSMRCAVFQWG